MLVAQSWKLKSRTLHFRRQPIPELDEEVFVPNLMGIVNVTPDSFSDGGKFFDHSAAVEHATQLAKEGADILDIGGESTRPYSDPVSIEDELSLVIPVIQGIKSRVDCAISIDTSKPEVARVAVQEGAEIINDVTGFRDPEMIKLAVDSGAGVCAMHMQGTPQTMQDAPQYSDVVEDILLYLSKQLQLLKEAGVEQERICLDPGIGFGKTHAHNLTLLRQVYRFHELGSPILIGHSRKGFIAKVMQDTKACRTPGTIAVALAMAAHQIQVIRVHDVQAVRHALLLFAATYSGK